MMAAFSAPLRTIPLLSRLTEAQIDQVAGIVERVAFVAGDEIVRKGEQAEASFILIDGDVDCLTREADEDAEIATALPAGAILLELAMFVPIDVTATCIARGNTRMLRISRDKMLEMMERDVRLTDAVVEALTVRLRSMADIMREANTTFDDDRKTA